MQMKCIKKSWVTNQAEACKETWPSTSREEKINHRSIYCIILLRFYSVLTFINAFDMRIGKIWKEREQIQMKYVI